MNLRRTPLAWLLVVTALGFAAPLAAQPPAAPSPIDEARKAYAAGDWSTAAAAYEKAAAAQPQNPMLKMRLGQCYVKLGKWSEAAAALDQAAQGGAPAPVFLVDRAGAYARLGQNAKALEILQQAVANGFGQAKAIESSPDLASLKGDPAFAAVVTGADKNFRPCQYDEKARALDFWAGDWNVMAQGGQAGTSHVEIILEGCVVFENWTATVGGSGKSFNLWDNKRQRWQQTWVDNRGVILEMYGQFVEPGKLVYEGDATNPAGQPVKNRMSFTKLEGDKVRQLWEQSSDGGKTWNVAFDGEYQRKKT